MEKAEFFSYFHPCVYYRDRGNFATHKKLQPPSTCLQALWSVVLLSVDLPLSLGTKPYYSITQVPLHIWPLSQYKRPSELDTQATFPWAWLLGDLSFLEDMQLHLPL